METKKLFIYIASLLLTFNVMAQDRLVVVKKDGKKVKYALSKIDSLVVGEKPTCMPVTVEETMLEFRINEDSTTAEVDCGSCKLKMRDNPVVFVIPCQIVQNGKVYNVTGIGSCAFEGCSDMPDFIIPNFITYIGNEAFIGTNIKTIEIPSSVIKIDDRAFSNCDSLVSAEISSSVAEIGEGVFAGCENLTLINVSEDNQKYSSLDGVLYDKDKTTLLKAPMNIPSVKITSSVKVIGDLALESCRNLTEIEIPSSVIKIGDGAFSKCDSLFSVEISSSVAEIGDWVFSECSSLTSINVSEDNQKYSSLEGVLYNKDKTTLLTAPVNIQSIKIPTSVNVIGEGAFESCRNLTEIEIPSSVTKIAGWTFYGCDNLKTAKVPNNCALEKYAFPSTTEIIRY